MKMRILMSMGVLGLVAAAALAQVSEEEAMKRLKEKQQAREHATSQPGAVAADPSDLAMLRSLLKDLRKENANLREEVANLKAENADLLKQVMSRPSGNHATATAPAGKSIFEVEEPKPRKK